MLKHSQKHYDKFQKLKTSIKNFYKKLNGETHRLLSKEKRLNNRKITNNGCRNRAQEINEIQIHN